MYFTRPSNLTRTPTAFRSFTIGAQNSAIASKLTCDRKGNGVDATRARPNLAPTSHPCEGGCTLLTLEYSFTGLFTFLDASGNSFGTYSRKLGSTVASALHSEALLLFDHSRVVGVYEVSMVLLCSTSTTVSAAICCTQMTLFIGTTRSFYVHCQSYKLNHPLCKSRVSKKNCTMYLLQRKVLLYLLEHHSANHTCKDSLAIAKENRVTFCVTTGDHEYMQRHGPGDFASILRDRSTNRILESSASLPTNAI